jgi:ubiquitin-protein ligase
MEIFEILQEPPSEDLPKVPAAELWRQDRAKYYETAREWTRKYAM